MSLLKLPRLPTFWFLLRLIGCIGILVGANATETAEGLVEQPLASRSGPRGKTMFRIMASQETGIVTQNTYSDPQMWASRHRELETGAVGTGVAIGDYDGDGRPDIFVVSKTESCRLFRNLGNWKFEDVTEAAGVADHGEAAGIWKQGATFADVNNDGLLDIYVCRFDAPNLLYINQGGVTFKEEAMAHGLAVKDSSVMAAFCDYDRDGWLSMSKPTCWTASPTRKDSAITCFITTAEEPSPMSPTARALPETRRAIRPPGGITTTTAGPISTSPMISLRRTRFTATVTTALSRTSSIRSCRIPRVPPWARTWVTSTMTD